MPWYKATVDRGNGDFQLYTSLPHVFLALSFLSRRLCLSLSLCLYLSLYNVQLLLNSQNDHLSTSNSLASSSLL